MSMKHSSRCRTSLRTCLALLALAAAPCAGQAWAGQRIVNGLETQAYPTTGALLHHAGGPITSANAAAWCTGTLIGCHTFLTAAHCAGDLVANHYWVYLQHGGIYAVSAVTPNPAYDGSSGNDVAIVTLASDVTGIAPTPINTTHDLAALGTGYAGIVAGFGQTSSTGHDYGIKRYGAVTTADCNTVATGGEGNDRLVCWDFTNPLGAPGTDSNTCNGDSGGPLFIDFGTGSEVVGVTSAGASVTCLPTDHSWDANVYFNSAFIQSHLAGDSTSACGSVLPVTDPSATVLADSGTLSIANTEDTYTVTITGVPALARFTANAKDNGSFHTAFYVKQGAGPASAASYDCKSDGGAVYAGCEFANPVAGPWSVTVSRLAGTGNYQLTTTLVSAPAAVCGNGVAESGEQCDGADLGSCVTGPCTANCTCPAPACGNNIVESGEACDGSSLGSCAFGPCNADCTCPVPVCGNNVIEGTEQCDGSNLGACANSPCNSDCTCLASVCGNDIVEAAEQCDGSADAACPGACDAACLCGLVCSSGDLQSRSLASTTTKLVYKASLLDPVQAYAGLDPRNGIALEAGDGAHTLGVAIPAADQGWSHSNPARGRYLWRGDGSIDGLTRVQFRRRQTAAGASWVVVIKGRAVPGGGTLDTTATLDVTLSANGTCHGQVW